MIENPQIGRQCWIITDIWETLCAVPVEIVAVEPAGGGIVCRWHITEEYSEDYDGLKPEDLFSTEAAARAAILEGRGGVEPWVKWKGGEDHARK